MFGKGMVLIISLTLLGTLVLQMRQRRLAMQYEMAQIHRQIDGLRKTTWDHQVRIAGHLHPVELQQQADPTGERLIAAHPVDGQLQSPERGTPSQTARISDGR